MTSFENTSLSLKNKDNNNRNGSGETIIYEHKI